eukprot:CAMPEP_0202721766 /NCGR_PEP_ID=MMETSP1385-20130828/151447_1 /ASSEMBLY_ACC=CAM_ASM_000861 /TAXON_ID=933848 /ORGANISM="Elphidium margaritaceum" /LENGTH=79 /DNA_ID=CAMNT_0049386103 /DNA_START=197 /DNA_END=433 /DNA_ORIENTATION=-
MIEALVERSTAFLHECFDEFIREHAIVKPFSERLADTDGQRPTQCDRVIIRITKSSFAPIVSSLFALAVFLVFRAIMSK